MRFPDDGFPDEEDEFGDMPLDEGGEFEEEDVGPPSDPILEGAIFLAEEAGDEEAAEGLRQTLEARARRWSSGNPLAEMVEEWQRLFAEADSEARRP